MSPIYVFVRTRIALRHSAGAVTGLLNEISCDWFRFGDRNGQWEDGFAFRVWECCSLPEFVDWLRPAMEGFEAWACHNGLSGNDHPAAASLDSYFRENAQRHVPTCQIFLRYNRESTQQSAEVDALRTELGRHGICRPGFYFRNGMILLVGSSEPAKTIFQRAVPLVRKLPLFLFTDPDGHCYSCRGREVDESVWRQIDGESGAEKVLCA